MNQSYYDPWAKVGQSANDALFKYLVSRPQAPDPNVAAEQQAKMNTLMSQGKLYDAQAGKTALEAQAIRDAQTARSGLADTFKSVLGPYTPDAPSDEFVGPMQQMAVPPQEITQQRFQQVIPQLVEAAAQISPNGSNMGDIFRMFAGAGQAPPEVMSNAMMGAGQKYSDTPVGFDAELAATPSGGDMGATEMLVDRMNTDPVFKQNLYDYQTGWRKGGRLGENDEVMPQPGYKEVMSDLESSKEFGKKVGGGAGEQLIELRTKAQSANESLTQNAVARKILDAGIKSGFGANFRLGFGKALKEAGINYSQDEITNTETYMISRARQVAENIKNFGAGTGLSDADRVYAEKMAAGSIALDEASMRRIMDMDDMSSRRLIARYNKEYQLAPASASPYDLGVEENIPTGGNEDIQNTGGGIKFLGFE